MIYLHKVLAAIESADVWLKAKKCIFATPEIMYLSYKILAPGMDPKKVRITEILPILESATELKKIGSLHKILRGS